MDICCDKSGPWAQEPRMSLSSGSQATLADILDILFLHWASGLMFDFPFDLYSFFKLFK